MSNDEKEYSEIVDQFFNSMGMREDKECDQHSSLDWIFLNGKDVLKHQWKYSIVALAGCMEISEPDMWGSHGEGFVYKDVCTKILRLAKPFLLSKNKKGYIDITSKLLNGTISPKDVHQMLELELEKGEMI